jgi:hypothetical protein
MTGLSFLIVYDDYSVAEAEFSKLELLTNGKLSQYNKYVELRYEGVKVRVPISVTDGTTPTPPAPPVEEDSSAEEEEDSSVEDSTSQNSSVEESSSTESGFDYSIIIIAFGLLVVGVAMAAIVLMFKNREETNRRMPRVVRMPATEYEEANDECDASEEDDDDEDGEEDDEDDEDSDEDDEDDDDSDDEDDDD